MHITRHRHSDNDNDDGWLAKHQSLGMVQEALVDDEETM